MNFHDSTPKNFFSKHENKAELKCLDDSEVLSSDFPGLNTSAASMTSVTSTASMASMTSTASFYQKILILMVWSSLAPKWPILVHFCGMDHQKSFFLLILAPFLWEAVEASQCYFFENWFIKLKCPTLLSLEAASHCNSTKLLILLPLRVIYFYSLLYETPCISLQKNIIK